MKIRNNGKEFVLTFNYKEYTIPEGEMDVNDDSLAKFILQKSPKIGHSVEALTPVDVPTVTPIEATPIKVETPVVREEEVQETTVDELVEDKKKKGKK